MPDTFTRSGKEILCGGAHFADAVNETAAEAIRIAMQDRSERIKCGATGRNREVKSNG